MDFLAALFAVLIGLAACFAGYRFFLILLPIWGFFAGLWLGFTGIQTLFGQGFLAGVSGLVVGVVLGLILAVLAYFFYYIGVIILGGSIGYGLTTSLLVGGLGMNPGFLVWAIAIVVAIAFAILFIIFNAQKLLIVLITALGGASAIIAGLLLLFGQITTAQLSENIGIYAPISFSQGAIWWLIWAALAVLGIVAQYGTTRSYTMETPDATRF
jgi:hypothetical protein